MNSSWEITKQRSTYHFDHFRIDPAVDTVTVLGNIEPFWKAELDSIIKLTTPRTWRTRGQGTDRPDKEYDQEEQDLERFGYGKDYVISDLTWQVPEMFNEINLWFGMSNSRMRLHVQHPGQVWNLHIDKLDKWHPEDPSQVMRVMIALTDWEPGHFWSYGNYVHRQWRAGDVTTFDWCNIPHATANAGHSPRVTLQITGVKTDATAIFLDKLKHTKEYNL